MGFILLVGIGLFAVAVVAALSQFRSRSSSGLSGRIDVLADGIWLASVELDDLGKNEVTIGREGDIMLMAETQQPEIIAVLRQQSGRSGSESVICEFLNHSTSPNLRNEKILHNGDRVTFGTYELVYHRSNEQQTMDDEGETYHVY